MTSQPATHAGRAPNPSQGRADSRDEAGRASLVSAEDAPFRIGRYEIRGEIGRGSMGVVYEGYDPSLHRTIALKTFHLSFAVSPAQYKGFEQRFFAEARIAARLSHPGIVAVHDVGCDPEIGTLYIALEYLEGRTLQEIIKDGAPLPWREALDLTRRVAEALHYAHGLQVIHRDIKPANIMRLPSGEPKILDFGIAKMVEAGSKLTTCQVFGTPNFMAPEQALGHKPDARADLFSLGAIAYTLLTGRLAFDAPSIPATVRRLVEEDPEPPSRLVPDLPPGLDALIARVLAKSPDRRHLSGRELVDDIDAIFDAAKAHRGTVLDMEARPEGLALTSVAPVAVPVPIRRDRPRAVRFALPALLAVALFVPLARLGSTRAPEAPGEPALVSAGLGPATRPTAGLQSAADVQPPSPAAAREPSRRPVAAVRRERVSMKTAPTPPASDAPAARPAPIVPARLTVRFEHTLEEGTLRLWVDNEVVLQQNLESRETSKIPGFKRRKGSFEHQIVVEPGMRAIRAQVRWDDSAMEQRLSANFQSGAARQLDLNLGRNQKAFSVEWR
ncbi:MAG TPA: protein kinase [Vicinamibacteria bacterium]